MKNEYFIILEGFDYPYQISTNGRIKIKNRIINSHIDKKNLHVYYFLRKNGHLRKFYAFKLVAEAFLKKPYNYPYIKHKDGNKQNNNIENLEYTKNIK